MIEEDRKLRETLRELAQTAKSPKDMLRKAIAKHPHAKKKAIALAAFREMLEAAGRQGNAARTLQDVGMIARVEE